MIIGVGTDLIEIGRVKAAITRRPGLKNRIFSPQELEYCLAKPDPWPSLAARFAAKEAVMKAMGVGIGACAFHAIEVIKEEASPPAIRLYGKALALARKKGISHWHLSLTHHRDDAMAFVIAESRD
jgi:holo-[acyl-carrier protein] synthase